MHPQILTWFGFASHYRCDFGLGRELDGHNAYASSQKNVALPLRWTDPAVLTSSIWTEASDVWSFGVTQIEVFTQASMPYYGWTHVYVIEQVKKGYRIPCPPTCPPAIYEESIRSCWFPSDSANERPTFSELVSRLTRLAKEANGVEMGQPLADASLNALPRSISESQHKTVRSLANGSSLLAEYTIPAAINANDTVVVKGAHIPASQAVDDGASEVISLFVAQASAYAVNQHEGNDVLRSGAAIHSTMPQEHAVSIDAERCGRRVCYSTDLDIDAESGGTSFNESSISGDAFDLQQPPLGGLRVASDKSSAYGFHQEQPDSGSQSAEPDKPSAYGFHQEQPDSGSQSADPEKPSAYGFRQEHASPGGRSVASPNDVFFSPDTGTEAATSDRGLNAAVYVVSPTIPELSPLYSVAPSEMDMGTNDEVATNCTSLTAMLSDVPATHFSHRFGDLAFSDESPIVINAQPLSFETANQGSSLLSIDLSRTSQQSAPSAGIHPADNLNPSIYSRESFL
jgi:hypothetical protein